MSGVRTNSIQLVSCTMIGSVARGVRDLRGRFEL
jgi:hypothetical protein